MTRSKTSSARSVVTDLTPEPQSAPRARAVVREVLRGSRIESVLDAAELCVSELVTNAVLHAKADLCPDDEQHSSFVGTRQTSKSKNDSRRGPVCPRFSNRPPPRKRLTLTNLPTTRANAKFVAANLLARRAETLANVDSDRTMFCFAFRDYLASCPRSRSS